MVIQSGANPTLAPRALPATDDLPRLAAHGLLDLGWVALRREEVPHPALPPVDAGLVLAHPGFGLALLDVAPARTTDSVARLRLRLAAIGFGKTFPGRLPIIHRSLEAEDLWRLPLVLDHAFAAEPPLELQGRAWIEVVQQALLMPPGETRPAPDASNAAAPTEPVPPAEAPALTSAAVPNAAAPTAAVHAASDLGADHEASTPEPDAPSAPRRASPLRRLAQASGVALLVLGAGAGVAQYLGRADPAPVVELPVPSAEGALRIVLHHPPGRRAEALVLAEPIEGSDAQVDLRALDAAAVDVPQDPVVRYFHADDQMAAQDLLRSLGPGWRLQDFTHLAPDTARGALEIWLPAIREASGPALPSEAGSTGAAALATGSGGAGATAAAPAQQPRPDGAAGTAPADPAAEALPAGPPPAIIAGPTRPEPAADLAAPAPPAASAAEPSQADAGPPRQVPPRADPAVPAPATARVPDAVAPSTQPAAPSAAAVPPPPDPGAQGQAPPANEPRAATPGETLARPAGAADAPAIAAPRQPETAVAGPAPADPPGPPPVPASPSEAVVTPILPVETPAVAAEPPARPAPAPPPPAIAPRAAEPTPPPRAAAPQAATLSPAVVEALLARGNQMLQQGDISGARLLFARAASAGSAAAATAMAGTYDEAVLTSLGARGIRPDAAQAAAWYRRAAELESAR
jgi:hypothetical protein